MATPTSLPATFVAGNVLTAAQMNDLRGASRILQVASVFKDDGFTTTSTSFADITDLSLTITPQETSNKVLIVASLAVGTDAGNFVEVVLDRNGTDIANNSDGRTAVFRVHDTVILDYITIVYLDSPASTSAQTYKVQMAVNTGTGYLNRPASTSSARTATSSFTIMEVSA